MLGYYSKLLACLSPLFFGECKGKGSCLLVFVFSDPTMWHVLNAQYSLNLNLSASITIALVNSGL